MQPIGELDARYSDEGAAPTAWTDVVDGLTAAPVFWVTTVRADGRPHLTPLVAVWLDGAMYFCTGPTEQKAKNLARNADCILSTGCNAFDEGLDLVVEGEAVDIRDDVKLHRVAEAYESKYGDVWHFDVRDGLFHHGAGEALVYEVVPSVLYAFAKGKFGHTRWRFPPNTRGR